MDCPAAVPGSAGTSGPSHLSEQDNSLKCISTVMIFALWKSAVNTSRLISYPHPAVGVLWVGFFPHK